MMERIFKRAEDKNVSALVVYADATYGYVDAAKTVKITTSELVNAFKKRALINLSGALYAPVSLTIAAGVATVGYAKAPSSGTSADFATIKSVADPVEE